MLDYRIITFLSVVDQGTLAKASDRLGLTQPAVSQHIKYLEGYYGIPLFDHIGRRLVLNDAGHLLYKFAREAESLFLQFSRQATSMTEGKKHYSLGATLTIGEFILPSYLGQYRTTHPELELTIQIENTMNILHLLDMKRIDLALVEGPFDRTRYKNRLLLQDEMIFIGDRSFVPESSKAITSEELAGSRLILREEGSGTRYFWEEYCKEHNIHIPRSSVTMEIGSLSAIKSLVEAGVGCSVMSRWAVRQELLLGTLRSRPFAAGPLKRNLYFVYNEDSPHTFIHAFADFIEKHTL
ncbi:LysR family transcriptional regulator [Oceanispirochaeta crateris]|uniref:LysR family transcriptional regulator n=1 Tax=Oceanispirochaeta crateris TaxID=2518645 RepID=A0A5C1QHU4_9SPIO|nr:LysR family transcriptional regulator [Oceanispirochaeta crateris]QEN06560.1 LysR family transcriptional regulator [Oceanispirochaeta crateris]